MRRIWAVSVKELRQVVRDPLTLGMLLGVPAFMLLLYGYALNFDVRHVPLAVQDRDRSVASRELIASFVNSTYFDRVRDLPVGTAFDEVTERRQAMAILVIPEEFGRDLTAGRTAKIQLFLDGTDANTANTILGYASALISEQNVAIARRALSRRGASPPDSVAYQPRVWYNPELRSTNFLVPGLIGFILMLTAVLSTALSVVREKERGTLEQLRVTPLRIGQMIVGKTLPYLAISLAASAVIIVVARALFDVAVRGSYFDLFLAILVYLIGALGFGLLVSSFARSQAMAFQAGALLSMLPAIFLSGFIFPLRAMPPLLRLVTYAFPARYFLVVLRGIILKGAGLFPYRDQMLFLILYALAVLGIAYLRLLRAEVTG
jgi:ABC-2 type transport system permease protein